MSLAGGTGRGIASDMISAMAGVNSRERAAAVARRNEEAMANDEFVLVMVVVVVKV
jgi:hypothetical protein